MAPEKIEAILAEIDALVGKPEDESPEDRAKRAETIERHARRRAAGVRH
jgi:hypothetical protein